MHYAIVKGQPMKIHSTTPILRIFDETKAKEFYVDYLGFDLEWEHRFTPGLPVYMEIRRDQCVLHLSEHHGDCCPGSAMRIEVDDIDELYADLGTKNFSYARPTLVETPWGTRDMSVKDPFGNRLTFTTAIST